jgi:toxin ParE1/3/4
MTAESRRLIWAPAAKADLREIWRYFARVASREVADSLLGDLQQAGERARQRPLAWRARNELMPGLRSILVHPYALFYRVKGDTIEVVRVLHQRRNIAAVLSDDRSSR